MQIKHDSLWFTYAQPPFRAVMRPETPVALPTSVVEQVLAFAPLVNPYSSRSTPELLGVLSRKVIPVAFVTLLLVANLHRRFPSCPLVFEHLVTASDNDLGPFFADVLFAKPLSNKLRGAQVPFLLALTKAGKVALLPNNAVDFLDADDDLDRAQVFRSFMIASVESGRLQTFDWWYDTLQSSGMQDLVDMATWLSVRDAAIKHGKTDVLDRLFQNHLVSWAPSSWELASRHGQEEVLDWAKARRVPFPVDPQTEQSILDSASRCGHVNVLNWWRSTVGRDRLKYSTAALDWASAGNHVQVLDWWARSGLLLKFTPDAFFKALDAGHNDVVCFWSECGEYQYLSGLDFDVVGNAVNPDHPQSIPIRLRSCDPVTLAAFGRLKWLKSLFVKALDLQQRMDIVRAAAQYGHLEVLEHCRPSFTGAYVPCSGADPVIVAVENGHLAVLKWLMSNLDCTVLGDNANRESLLSEAAGLAIENKHTHIMAWFLTNAQTWPYMVSESAFLIAIACELAVIPILTLFAAERLLQSASSVAKAEALIAAVWGDQVTVFEWWDNNKLSWPVWSDLKPRSPVTAALESGQIRVLDWLLAHPHCGVDWSCVSNNVIASLVVERRMDSLAWLRRHGDKIGLCQWSKQHINQFVGH